MGCGRLWYFSLALALGLLPEVVRQSAFSFALCGQALATGCVGSVVLDQLFHWATHDYLFFVLVIFLGLPHFWTPLGVLPIGVTRSPLLRGLLIIGFMPFQPLHRLLSLPQVLSSRAPRLPLLVILSATGPLLPSRAGVHFLRWP